MPETTLPRRIELGEDGALVLRTGGIDDVEAVRSLYERLGAEDLRRRFFVARRPPDATIERWLSVGTHGGLVLVAEIDDGTAPTLVAEAGYALLSDGVGELGITVDPAWRGWMGPWLLDAITSEAAARGVRDLEAEVLVANRPMRTLLERRGHAVVDHPDWQHVRLAISTTGTSPGWPETEERRLLVVTPTARWPGEEAARAQGFDVRSCPGPEGRRSPCPLLDGGTCPLVDGAEAVVFALPLDVTGRELLAGYRSRRPAVPVVLSGAAQDAGDRPPCDVATDVLGRIDAALTEAEAEVDVEAD